MKKALGTREDDHPSVLSRFSNLTTHYNVSLLIPAGRNHRMSKQLKGALGKGMRGSVQKSCKGGEKLLAEPSGTSWETSMYVDDTPAAGEAWHSGQWNHYGASKRHQLTHPHGYHALPEIVTCVHLCCRLEPATNAVGLHPSPDQKQQRAALGAV